MDLCNMQMLCDKSNHSFFSTTTSIAARPHTLAPALLIPFLPPSLPFLPLLLPSSPLSSQIETLLKHKIFFFAEQLSM
jgi:hypothetical protein